jgi:hypothetical protein
MDGMKLSVRAPIGPSIDGPDEPEVTDRAKVRLTHDGK